MKRLSSISILVVAITMLLSMDAVHAATKPAPAKPAAAAPAQPGAPSGQQPKVTPIELVLPGIGIVRVPEEATPKEVGDLMVMIVSALMAAGDHTQVHDYVSYIRQHRLERDFYMPAFMPPQQGAQQAAPSAPAAPKAATKEAPAPAAPPLAPDATPDPTPHQ